ncbi:DUF4184 family protein [Microbacterium sp. C7(2022)]|uniref:DUF4184 family protein n=1 Tax=Microbacterium sp. C7(2022) TaxID=2992759 RepID=UPI00237A39C7|nr:DUF4184 family protein [Microbacterium sp. C7(2022)]MDE0545858.1 DUF4184 family protein [Microbacterium sp. C7(2022)]
MPFTPSHAVVALPFVRTPLVPAAIAVGAMTPDLPLFVRAFPLHYGFTHDFGWLPATVILALVLLLVWRCVLRPAVRELAPNLLAQRLPSEWDRGVVAALRETFGVRRGATGWAISWLSGLLLLVSLLIGVVSHIVWDLFTHEGRWGVVALPVLEQQWGPLVGFKWIQHGSSLLGLGILAAYALVWVVRREAAPVAARVLPAWVRLAWIIALPVFLVTAWMWGLAAYGPLDATWTVAHLAYRVLPPACAVWGVATLGLCIVVQATRRARYSL